MRSFIALGGILALVILFPPWAFADMASAINKPDTFAHKHYSANSVSPSAKAMGRVKGLARVKPKLKTSYSEDEIAAEVAREDAGREQSSPRAPAVESAAKPQPDPVNRRPKFAAGAPARESSESYTSKERAPIRARSNPDVKIFVCHFSVDRAKRLRDQTGVDSRFLISDSDGFEACGDRGGKIMAGNEDDRELTNVKESSSNKRAKK